jgi:hypothetical protein
MINLLFALLNLVKPAKTAAPEFEIIAELETDCCDGRTHEIMSGDTVMFWDDQLRSMEIGEFLYLYEWQEPMFESPYETECSVNGYEPVWRAIIRRWDGIEVAAVCDSVELF